MSNTDLNKEFTDFGNRMNLIAILTLLSFILGIVGAFVPIVGIIALIFSVIIIIFFLLVLGNVKRAGKILTNKELLDFSPRFLLGTIIRFIGQVFMQIGLYFIFDLWVLIIIGVALILVGCILRYMAWGGMQVFFETNAQLFPQDISYNANKGSKLCKYATILDMTIILSFIGEILRIIGYFKLASTKNMVGAPAKTVVQPSAPVPAPTPASPGASPNFCPNCGSSVTPGAKFCPSCGSDIS
ncbi:MAG: zinc-ribbon domain-containing protein [Candidatus Hermodarchaeota archaeon]